MELCTRLVHKEDGTFEACSSKYNGKYLLENLLVCRDYGASYRRRTERAKIVWRCATSIGKGKNLCANSPTLDEEWVQDTLSKVLCKNGVYDKGKIRNEVVKIQGFDTYIIICYKNREC